MVGRSNTPEPLLARKAVYGLAALSFVGHVATALVTPYSIHRDELLYLAMGKYLAFWRMDFPPLIALLANSTRWLFGDSLAAIRLLPAVAGALLVILSALMARELGGKGRAQVLTSLAVLLNPLFLRAGALFQPTVFDQLWWTGGLYCFLRLLKSDHAKWWILLGVAGGFGLLTKFSIAFFGIGVLAGILLTHHRNSLLTPRPYVAMAIALTIGSPSIIGQIQLDFPVLAQLQVLQEVQLSRVTPISFLFVQLLVLGPAVILAGLGIWWLIWARAARQFRAIGWACLTSFVAVLALQGKPYYVGPLYPILLAAGAVAIGMFDHKVQRIAGIVLMTLILAYGVVTLPLGLPIVPPEPMARYSVALGASEARTSNTGEVLSLPQDYADMVEWEDQVSLVARVYHTLPADKKAKAVIMARNYGEAGAIDFFGPRHGLPRAVCVSGSYWFFGPGQLPGEVVVSIGLRPDDVQGLFRSVEIVGHADNRWTVPEERNIPVMVCESPRQSLQELWPRFKGIN
ncbi:MAG: glycosyltransferase family 39 protein [candidate division Zixibacteria bacterium]|nr:glycosyltransferase family 39 protein [candidate division Zixibacteria bacterium]